MAGTVDKGWDLGGYLREQREHARLSVRQLANLAGVSNPYLSQVERGLRKPSAEVLQQIARGLRISAEALYVRAGILDSEGRPDVEAAVNADPDLNDRQRRVLLDIYASFRAENRRASSDEPEPTPRRRPAVSVRSAAKTAKSATRGATRASRAGARAAGASNSVEPPAEASADSSTTSSTDSSTGSSTDSSTTSSTNTTGSSIDRAAAAASSAPAPRASGRVPRKRATARTAERATTRSTKAAPRAATAESDTTSPEPGGAPDEHL